MANSLIFTIDVNERQLVVEQAEEDGTAKEDDSGTKVLKYLFRYTDMGGVDSNVHTVIMFPTPVYHTNKHILKEYLTHLRKIFGVKAAYGTLTPGGYLVHYYY